MKYTLENGKVINIPDAEIENHMKKLGLTKEEAIQLYLEDEGLEENEELEELDAKAKKVRVQHGATSTESKKESKPRTVKVSDEKTALFDDIFGYLSQKYDVSVEKANKLFKIHINDKEFKLDLIETRQKKK